MLSNNAKDLYLIGFAAVWGLIFLFIYRFRFSKRSKANVEVEATVVWINEHLSTAGRAPNRIMVYQPTFEYEWKGFKRRIQSDIWSSNFNFKLGDKVTLLIDPGDASNYKFKDGSRDPFTFIVFIFVMVIIVVLAAMFRK